MQRERLVGGGRVVAWLFNSLGKLRSFFYKIYKRHGPIFFNLVDAWTVIWREVEKIHFVTQTDTIGV